MQTLRELLLDPEGPFQCAPDEVEIFIEDLTYRVERGEDATDVLESVGLSNAYAPDILPLP